MAKNIKLSQIFFGQIDAKNELINDDKESRDRFEKAFISPPKVSIEQLKSSNTYFVIGPKGVGKTAMLRYLGLQFQRDLNTYVKFIFFKNEFSEEDRVIFSKAGNINIVQNSPADSSISDFEPVWRWFFHRYLASCFLEKTDLVEKNEDFERYIGCVNSVEDVNSPTGIWKWLPNLKRGSVEISATPKISLDFDWEDSAKTRVKFGNLVRQADELFAKLRPGLGILKVFMDEIELAVSTQKQYLRDVAIIRDLVLSIEKMNAVAKSSRLRISFIAGIRTEIINAIGSVGKEINKPLSDFGININWSLSGNIDSQPITEILVQRIYQAELEVYKKSEQSKDLIWSRYFPHKIFSESPKKFILQLTWFKPRDLVRLMNAIKTTYPNATEISEVELGGIRKEYSIQCWSELSEELAAKYSAQEIESIKQIFIGFKRVFTLEDFNNCVKQKSINFPDIEALINKYKAASLLIDLYRVGILGNQIQSSESSHRNAYQFFHRDDHNLLLSEKMVIHNALLAFFNIC